MKGSKASKYLLKTNRVPFPISCTFHIQILLIPYVRPISIVTSSVKHALISPAGSHSSFLKYHSTVFVLSKNLLYFLHLHLLFSYLPYVSW